MSKFVVSILWIIMKALELIPTIIFISICQKRQKQFYRINAHLIVWYLNLREYKKIVCLREIFGANNIFI